jgi:K+-sensing histidine kinase KdpD
VLVLDMGQALAPPMYQELWDIYAKGPPGGLQISGTGIGLSLCKELVTSMGGRVWAGPRRDMGSAFAISLRIAGRPVEPDPEQAREKPVVAAAATVPAAA